MTCTVGNIGYKFQRVSLRISEQTVDCLDDDLDDINILPLVETADIVCVGNLSVVENDINGTCMVDYIKPIADILAFAGIR